ncbi:MAG: hypothetical protein AB7S77_24765 [Desulfatirhabdiaceae bacterium]
MKSFQANAHRSFYLVTIIMGCFDPVKTQKNLFTDIVATKLFRIMVLAGPAGRCCLRVKSEITSRMDLSTLEVDTEDYEDDQFKTHFSDVVASVQLTESCWRMMAEKRS